MGPAPAHPHVCGENGEHCAYPVEHPGSSPRVRGKLRGRPGGRHDDGLIPARAGKTPRAPWRPSRRWAHPRVCGENMRCWPCRQATWGSSPRVRGKQVRHRPPRRRRLIPACAGKTSGHVAERAVEVGSSPRVRGKRPLGLLGLRDRGLIPACAGKTTAGTPRSARPRAHPRVCGENIVSYVAVIVLCGSSPRVRGKRFRGVPCETATGLIPACAGKIQPLRG